MDRTADIIELLGLVGGAVTVSVAAEGEVPDKCLVVAAGGQCGLGHTLGGAGARALANIFEAALVPALAVPAEDRSNGHRPAEKQAPPAAKPKAHSITSADLERIRERLGNASAASIAEELGLSVSAVGYHLTKMRKEARENGSGFPAGKDLEELG